MNTKVFVRYREAILATMNEVSLNELPTNRIKIGRIVYTYLQIIIDEKSN